MSSLEQSVHDLMQRNLKDGPNGTYTVPSLQSYPYQWFWDSCFAAIIWSKFDPKRAQAELRTLMSAQYDNGFCGHIVYWEKGPIIDIDWGYETTSSLLQPPLIAYAAWRAYEADGNRAFLEELLPALERYYHYVLTTRNVRVPHIYGYINSDESGEDNSPRFDEAMQLPPQHGVETHLEKRIALFAEHSKCHFAATCTADHFWVEDVGLNTYLVWNLEYLAKICDVLDLSTAATSWRSHSKAIAEAMRSHMFIDDRFLSLTGKDATPVTVPTWIDFLPLLTRQYTSTEADHLVGELLDTEHYWLPYGIPTVSKQAAAYDPHEPTWGEAWQHPHWRGPSWQCVHWFLHQGLTNYGYHTEATLLRHKAEALIAAEGFREYYHPETGKGLGAHNFTWGGLVLDMEYEKT